MVVLSLTGAGRSLKTTTLNCVNTITLRLLPVLSKGRAFAVSERSSRYCFPIWSLRRLFRVTIEYDILL